MDAFYLRRFTSDTETQAVRGKREGTTVTPVWEITARVWLVKGILKRFLLDTGIRKDLFSILKP